MEDALVHDGKKTMTKFDFVLILVLMEDALVRKTWVMLCLSAL